MMIYTHSHDCVPDIASLSGADVMILAAATKPHLPQLLALTRVTLPGTLIASYLYNKQSTLSQDVNVLT